jgi:copper chaperone CopZ
MENQKNSSKGVVATGIIAAIAASSCCIPPVIAAIAGVGGASTNLSWMEPFRPYLIGLAVVAIGYAWYNHLKLKKKSECCEIEKPKFFQTKGFLIGMTIFAALSIGFPYYSGTFFPNNKKNVVVKDRSSIQKITTTIEGMTCDACQSHVNHAINELSGIMSANTSYDNGCAIVEFDKTVVTSEEIIEAINSTGYIVTKSDLE